MAGHIGAKIDDSMIPAIINQNRLRPDMTRAEVIRYCLAITSGMDHYDALREAEKPRNESTRKAHPNANGLTLVSADIPKDLLHKAMSKLGVDNISQAIRYALASTTGQMSDEDVERHAVMPAGKPVGRPRNTVTA